MPVRTSSESRLPGRSRTPWDAGGYSLPLTLNVKNVQNSQAAKPSFYTEATPVDSVGSTSPKSPKHKFSDSRSSLSSYTTMSSNTSSHSRSHSRISSLSTVSEYQPMNSFMSDSTPTERRMSDPDSGMTCPTVVEIQPPSPSRRGFEDVSPDASDNDSPMHSDRPRSPSDAILVRNRGLAGSARYVELNFTVPVIQFRPMCPFYCSLVNSFQIAGGPTQAQSLTVHLQCSSHCAPFTLLLLVMDCSMVFLSFGLHDSATVLQNYLRSRK